MDLDLHWVQQEITMLFLLHSGSVAHFHAAEIGLVLLLATIMVGMTWKYAARRVRK